MDLAPCLRIRFNYVLETMMVDEDDLLENISNQVDDYKKMRSFGKQLVVKQQKDKEPLASKFCKTHSCWLLNE